MINYQAPKPQYLRWQLIRFILIRCLIIPLLWDLLKWVLNPLLGPLFRKLVLKPPPLSKIKSAKQIIASLREIEKQDLSIKTAHVTTHDKARLDTLLISYQQQQQVTPQDQRYIIHFFGRKTNFEKKIVDTMMKDAKHEQCNVIGFNYRGIGYSTKKAKSADDLVTDGIAQVQRLLAMCVRPELIVLKGRSLGGAVASRVALHFHQRHIPIKVYNMLSFSTVTKVAMGYIQSGSKKSGHQVTPLRKCLSYLAWPIVKFFLMLSQWEIEGGSAFMAIPKAFRDYILVRSDKLVREEKQDDTIISHMASLHQYLKKERKEEKKGKSDLEIKAIKTASHRRKMYSHTTDMHHEDFYTLKNDQDEPASTLFHQFFESSVKNPYQAESIQCAP